MRPIMNHLRQLPSGAKDTSSLLTPWQVTCLLLLLVVCTAAAPSAIAKDDDKNKAIVKYVNEEEGKSYIADLLYGIDLEKGKLIDQRTGSLKVGIFAEEDSDGTLRNTKYKKKVIYPDNGYKKGSVKIILRKLYFKDIQNTFNKRYKTSKATKDSMLRRQKLLRLLSWCDTHYYPDAKKKVEKDLKKVDPSAMEEETSSDFFKHTEEQEKLIAALENLKDIETVALASTEHITVASDFLPPKTIERMLKTGERIYRDFMEIMYVDGVRNLKDAPQGEICRIYYLTHTTTLEEALTQASKFGTGLSDVKHAESMKKYLYLGGLSMGSVNPKTRAIMKFSFSTLETRDKDDPSDMSKVTKRDPAADYTNRLVSSLADALMDNWLGNPPAFKGRITMPWLSEGFSHYLCIKNLGVLGTFSTDFDFEYAERDTSGGYRWEGDIEETMRRVAQDPTADKIPDLFRIAHYRNLRTESVCKSVSLIDFLMEKNKIGFLNFLKDLQKHYRKLDKTGDQQKFIDGLDNVIGANLGSGSSADSGMASRLKRKSAILGSVADLEKAWRDWASSWKKGKKRR
jgi:hypothetical protein